MQNDILRIVELTKLFSGAYNDRIFRGEKIYVFGVACQSIYNDTKNLWAFFPENTYHNIK
jgi:hypothetical protein